MSRRTKHIREVARRPLVPGLFLLVIALSAGAANAVSFHMQQGRSATAQVWTPLEGMETLSIEPTEPLAHGTFSVEDLQATTVRYTPEPAFFGTESFVIRVTYLLQGETRTLTSGSVAHVTQDNPIQHLTVTTDAVEAGGSGVLLVGIRPEGAWDHQAMAYDYAEVRSVSLPGVGAVPFTHLLSERAPGSFGSLEWIEFEVPEEATSGTLDIGVAAQPLPDAVSFAPRELVVRADQTHILRQGETLTGAFLHGATANQSVTETLGPQHGTVSVDDVGTSAFGYTPEAGFVGHDRFGYTVVTVNGQSYDVSVEVNVLPAAVISGVEASPQPVDLGQTLTLDVSLTGDWNAATQALDFATVRSVALAGAGTVPFTIDAVSPGAGVESQQTILVTVPSGAVSGNVVVGAGIDDPDAPVAVASTHIEVLPSQFPTAVYDDGTTRIFRRSFPYSDQHDRDETVDEDHPFYPEEFLAYTENLGLLLTFENINTSPYFDIPGYPTTLIYEPPGDVVLADGFQMHMPNPALANTAGQRFYEVIVGRGDSLRVVFDEPVQAFGFVSDKLVPSFEIRLEDGAVARGVQAGQAKDNDFVGIVSEEPFQSVTLSGMRDDWGWESLAAPTVTLLWRGFYLGRVPPDGPVAAGGSHGGQSFTGTDFTHQVLSTTEAPSDLSGADLSGAVLRRARLHGADLRDATLTGADLLNADLAGADLRGANLADAALYAHAHYRGANLSGQDLTQGPLFGADLAGADLSGSVLRDAGLRYARLQDASLAGVDVAGADLFHAVLTGADLRGSNLRQASDIRATYSGANLTGLDLHDTYLGHIRAGKLPVRFVNAILVGTDFNGSSLYGAVFDGADLRGANLSGTEVSEATFTGALHDQLTVFPDGFDPVAEGMIYLERPSPTAADDAAEVITGGSVAVDLLANDAAGEGALDPSSVTLVSGPSSGTVTIGGTTGEATYSPTGGFVGTDRFTYHVADDAGLVSNPATVSIQVMSTPPTLSIQDISAVRGKKFTVPILLSATYGVTAATFKIAFDPSRLTINEQDVRSTDLSDDMVVIADAKQTNGSLAISLAGENPLSAGGGVLVEVPVTVRSNAAPGDVTTLSFVSASVIVEGPSGELTVVVPVLEDGSVNVYAPGDPTGDGIVDLQDAIFIMRSIGNIQNLTEAQLLLADADGNGLINIDDAVFVVRSLTSARPLAVVAGALDPVAVLLEATESAGQVRVPVVLDGAGGIVGLDVSLRYDASRFALESVELTSPESGTARWADDGRVRLSGLSPAGMGGSEPVAELVLRRRGGASGEAPVELAGARLVALSGELFPVLDGRPALPAAFALLPAYPNPFNPETVIRYQLPVESAVQVTIYDALGQRLETLVRDTKAAGTHRVRWVAGNRAPGLYFAVVEAAGMRQSTKMMLLK